MKLHSCIYVPDEDRSFAPAGEVAMPLGLLVSKKQIVDGKVVTKSASTQIGLKVQELRPVCNKCFARFTPMTGWNGHKMCYTYAELCKRCKEGA